MSFLRRMLGNKGEQPRDSSDELHGRAAASWPEDADEDGPDDEDEAERERALLRADAERLDDELLQRQLRYADRSWTPAPQGGERRADEQSRERG